MPIETDYRPDFGLGAFYQGINAANSKQLSEEDILKAFLANQREQQQQPLDTLIKTWEATHAQDKLNSPEYRDSMLKGYMGQMNSQIAAGKKAMGTVESDISATNQDNQNRLFMGKTLEEWNNIRLGREQEQSQSGIGFNRQPQEQVSPIGNISKQKDMLSSIGTDYKNTPDMPSANYMINEINRGLSNPNIKAKDKQDLLKEKQRILAELNGQPPVLSNMVKEPQVQVQQPQNNVLSKLQNILVNTPEHLQKMELYKQQGANQANTAEIRGQYLLEAALSRLQKPGEKPLTRSQGEQRALAIIGGLEQGDVEAAQIYLREADNSTLRRNPAAYNGSNMNLPATQQSGQVENFPSAVQQAGALEIRGHVPSVVPTTQLPKGWKQVDKK
jgi:hypothetical protein